LKKLLETLTVREADLPRVELALNTLIRGVTVSVVILVVITLGWLISTGHAEPWMIIGLVWLAAMFGLTRLHRRGHINATINLLLATITAYATLADPLGFPMPGLNQAAYAIPIAIAALLLTPTAGLIWAGIVTLANLSRTVAVAAIAGEAVNFGVLFLNTAGLNIVTLIMWFFGHSFQQTRRGLRRQIRQGQASIEIGHTVTAALDPSSIIQQTVQLIYDAFGYYHVGLFTLSPDGSIAVLAEAAGEAAASLKEREFHISLAGTSAVATAINQKRRRRVVSWEESLDHRGRTVQFTYDRLPTRAELALPLVVRDQILGALDIHSTELYPFPEEDIHTLEGLIGNVANALDIARLLDDVQQRHQELAAVYAQTERRSRYLETTAQLARATSALLDPEALLHRAVDLVSQGLDLYHAGIFMIDETAEWAVLTAANSKGGQQMMARGHKLRVCEQGIVGWVTQAGQPRIALDVGEDAVYFDNPDLPDTRSEVALPLKIGDRVIGALDVQSVREAAFSKEDMTVLQILADQVAVAIENARLFQATQGALEEVQALQRYYVAQEWEQLSRQRSDLNAEYRSLGVPSIEAVWTPEMEMVLTKEEPVVLSDLGSAELGGDGRGYTGESQGPLPARAALAVPIKLRGETIGVLDLQETDETRDWTEEDVATATSVADQLALVLENARLFEDAHSRAEERAVLNELAQALTARLDVNQVVEEAYRGTSRLLDTTNFYIALYDPEGGTVSFPLSTENGQSVQWESRQAGEGLTEYIIRNRQPLLMQENLSAQIKELGIEMIGKTALSWLGVPLVIGDRVLGTMTVQSYTTPRLYDEHAQGLLTAIASQTAIALQNARLFEETHRRAQELEGINEVGRAITSVLDQEAVLRQVVDVTKSRFDHYFVSILLMEDDQLILQDSSTIGDSDVRLEGGKVIIDPQTDASLAAEAARTGQPVLVNDVLSDPRYLAVPELADTRSEVDMPMTVKGRVTGVLNVQSDQPNAFSQTDVALLQSLANQAGVAIENARLFEETQRRMSEIQLLHDVGLAAASEARLEETLQSIAEALAAAREADLVALMLLDEESNTLGLDAGVGYPSGVVGHERIPVGQGVTGWVIEHGEPALVPDMRQDSRCVGLEGVGLTLRSELCVPLAIGSRIIGVINMEDRQVNAFTDNDVRLLTALASNVSVFVERARLFEETGRRARQLAAINEVGQAMTAVLDPDQLMRQVVGAGQRRPQRLALRLRAGTARGNGRAVHAHQDWRPGHRLVGSGERPGQRL